MRKINNITIDRSKYDTEEKFYRVLGKTIGNLLDLEQIIVAQYEDYGIYNIQFMSDNRELGDYMPYWLLPEEYEQVILTLEEF